MANTFKSIVEKRIHILESASGGNKSRCAYALLQLHESVDPDGTGVLSEEDDKTVELFLDLIERIS